MEEGRHRSKEYILRERNTGNLLYFVQVMGRHCVPLLSEWQEVAVRKQDLTCSAALAALLTGVPEDADIESVAVFVGVKGGGVFMGSHLTADPQEIAAMISALGEAKGSIIEGIIRDHGMETMVTVMYFLASSHPNARDLGNDPDAFFRKYFIPRPEEAR